MWLKIARNVENTGALNGEGLRESTSLWMGVATTSGSDLSGLDSKRANPDLPVLQLQIAPTGWLSNAHFVPGAACRHSKLVDRCRHPLLPIDLCRQPRLRSLSYSRVAVQS